MNVKVNVNVGGPSTLQARGAEQLGRVSGWRSSFKIKFKLKLKLK